VEKKDIDGKLKLTREKNIAEKIVLKINKHFFTI